MKKNTVKFLSEILPLAAFFIVYKFYGIIEATATIVVFSVLGLLLTYYTNKKVSQMHLFTTIVILIFGGLTVFSNNPVFIKLKPTILNILFASILAFGLLTKKIYLKS